jgi:hypothetical protein
MGMGFGQSVSHPVSESKVKGCMVKMDGCHKSEQSVVKSMYSHRVALSTLPKTPWSFPSTLS